MQLINEPLIKLSDNELKRGKKILSKFIPKECRIVTLHVRDSGFYGSQHKTTRDADIKSYEKAIQYLINRRYVVVRMGDSSMVVF